ncbi:MAG: bifunctional 4-hydroxy-2-oxoglutarate aldolase/2-dehydro-3-deoxy-phosphogluconate aldolase [Planctomycetota bacterium]
MRPLERLADHRCSAILRTHDASAVRPAMDAAIAGGFRVVEITLTTPGALDTIAHYAADEQLLVGAGTVLDADAAQRALDAGARFLVSPVTDPHLIGWCAERDVLLLPGAFTPTEMRLAVQSGAQVVKLFPAPPGGPDYVRACLGPMPELRLFPTAGVSDGNASAFLEAGAFGVGFVGNLFVADDLAQRRFAAVTERARRMVGAIEGTRRP